MLMYKGMSNNYLNSSYCKKTDAPWLGFLYVYVLIYACMCVCVCQCVMCLSKFAICISLQFVHCNGFFTLLHPMSDEKKS